MWRAAQNSLPTAENLWKKKVLQQPWCQRCGKQGENVVHALFSCKVAQKVWRNIDFVDEMKLFVNQDLLSVLQDLSVKKVKAEIELFISICWATWHSRNLFIFEGKTEDS